MSVKEILNKKGARVLTVPQATAIPDAIERMKREKIGSLVVSDNGRDIHGILGATLSARAVSASVRRVLAFYEVLVRNGE